MIIDGVTQNISIWRFEVIEKKLYKSTCILKCRKYTVFDGKGQVCGDDKSPSKEFSLVC